MKLSHFLPFLLVLVACKNANTNLHKVTAKTIAVDNTITPSSQIDSIIAPYKEKLTGDMQEVLTYTPKNLTKKNVSMQSTLGNLLADMCVDMANPIFKEKTGTLIDFSMFNAGGIRATIPAGKVTIEHAFKVMPFENELVVVTLTGNKVMELVNYFIENKKAHPLSENVELTINETDYILKINDQPFNKNKSYTVLTSDFLQGGGDRMVFFKNPEKLTKLNYKLRDAIIHYFKKVDTLKTAIDNRIKIN